MNYLAVTVCTLISVLCFYVRCFVFMFVVLCLVPILWVKPSAIDFKVCSYVLLLHCCPRFNPTTFCIFDMCQVRSLYTVVVVGCFLFDIFVFVLLLCNHRPLVFSFALFHVSNTGPFTTYNTVWVLLTAIWYLYEHIWTGQQLMSLVFQVWIFFTFFFFFFFFSEPFIADYPVRGMGFARCMRSYSNP